MSEANLIALFGASCTGKTTLARRLTARTHWQVRCCGDIVRARALDQGIQISELAFTDHADIDEETRLWSASPGVRIVEGRFLDQVLLPVWPKQGVLIEVKASVEKRAERWAERLGKTISSSDVARFDEDDAAFRVQAYDGVARLQPHWPIDTTESSADACLEEILEYLKNKGLLD